ncbi:MAG: M1 family metallopeptidase [Ignavibacteria bacterium]|jgi:hypothetical protein
MKILLLIIFCSIFASQNFAQNSNIYIPPKLHTVYESGTRSYDGNPGESYWQNRADYKINVEINTEKNELTGSEIIKFYNNSPDTLQRLYIKLFQDLYKKGTMIDYPIGPADLHDGTEISLIKINGEAIDLDSSCRRMATNLVVTKLPENIAPNSVTEIEINWKFIIPSTSQIRMGVYRNNAYFIAYFFPRVAVYDDINGWDRTTHSGKVEFYNDFGNYDVEITVPKGFIVRATGDNTNAEETLHPKIYSRYEKALTSDEVLNIITPEDLTQKIITVDNDKNTWRFRAVNVPDFSFCATEDYLWDGVSVIVNENTDRRVFTDVIYFEGATFYQEAAQVSKETVEHMSKKMPGVPFPYSHMTCFCNGERGGGMETPMMANNGMCSSYNEFHTLIHHENSHTYFPFYVGTNETLYGWMDEGWATFFPVGLIQKKDEDYSKLGHVWNRYVRPFAGSLFDIPPMVPSDNTSGIPLVANTYGRSYLALLVLESALGKEKFKECTKEFIKRWKGKHPTPYDFFFTYDNVAGEDLSWIWKPWYFEFGYADLALTQNSEGKLAVEKIGSFPVPFSLKIFFEDGIEEIINESVCIWQDCNQEFIINLNTNKKVVKAELLNEFYPDIIEDNNMIEF